MMDRSRREGQTEREAIPPLFNNSVSPSKQQTVGDVIATLSKEATDNWGCHPPTHVSISMKACIEKSWIVSFNRRSTYPSTSSVCSIQQTSQRHHSHECLTQPQCTGSQRLAHTTVTWIALRPLRFLQSLCSVPSI